MSNRSCSIFGWRGARHQGDPPREPNVAGSWREAVRRLTGIRTPSAVRELVVVISQHLPIDPKSDSTTPTRGVSTRWLGRVEVSHAAGLAEMAEFDRTQLSAVHVEQLRRSPRSQSA